MAKEVTLPPFRIMRIGEDDDGMGQGGVCRHPGGHPP